MNRNYCKIILFCFSCFLTQTLFAQNFTNSWINYSQKYYKIKVWRDSIYRITPQALTNAGIDLSTVHPKNFQIFAKGREVPIYVYGENDNDGIFNNNDFIEFYGERNTGWADSLVYDLPENILNTNVSLFNDTMTYYFTYNNLFSNRRVETFYQSDFTNYPTRNYVIAQVNRILRGFYSLGKMNAINGYSPEINIGEGYALIGCSPTVLCKPRFDPNNLEVSGPPTKVKLKLVSESEDINVFGDNRVNAYLNDPSGTLLFDETWDGISNKFINFDIPNNLLTFPTYIDLNILSSPGNNNKKISISGITYNYPRTLNLNSNSFMKLIIPSENITGSFFYNFTNFNSVNDSIWLWNYTLNQRIKVFKEGNNFKIITPNNSADGYCVIYSNNSPQYITNITPINSTGFFTDFSQINPATDFLIVTHPNTLDGALSYANYKNSKGFTSVVANINELYDQFAFGIVKNPLAIRKFAEYIDLTFPNPNKHLFLIGKSILHFLTINNPSNFAKNLVPTWGYFGSDEYITAKIGNAAGYAPKIPVGRLSATTNQQVQDYLNKVIEFESQPKALWMKDILHFAGGTTQGEQLQHLYFLNDYKSILQDTLFGGKVITYSKNTTAPIQISESDSIRNSIENGISIMNFFGHAAGSSFDVSPEPPSQYNNQGKYPLIMANSCYVGDLHQPPSATYQFVSEQYILTPNKGAIAFIAQASPGLASPGYYYTKAFYKNFGQTKYGQSIGKCIKAAIEDIQSTEDEVLKEACLTMTLHGDPSLVINAFDGPDYEIKPENIEFNPTVITTDLDSFFVNIKIKNLGSAVNKPIALLLKRFLPDSVVSSNYSATLNPVMYEGAVSFKLPVNLLRGPGINKLEVSIDALNVVAETNENNNFVSLLFDIKSDDITPLFPYKYSIVKNKNITLKGSTGDIFAPARNYIFEIDTTDTFLSAFKKQKIVNNSGGVIKWELPFLLTDSTVYFWRVSPDSSGIGYKWKESSFQHIPFRTGWEQSHFYQFKNNNYSLMKYNKPQRKFEFGALSKELSCFTWSAPGTSVPPDADLFATEYRIDQELIESAGNSYSPSIHVAVMDSVTLEPWGIRYSLNGVIQNPNNNFGNSNNMNPSNGHYKYFIFNVGNAAQMQGFKNMMLNGVPNGNYILIYTWVRGNFQSWADTSIFSVLENLGADSVRTLPNSRAWAFFAKKGYPQTAVEKFSPANGRYQVVLNGTMTSNVDFGKFSSELIGPSTRWDSLSWRSRPIEQFSNDSNSVTVYGVRFNGEKQKLLTFANRNGNVLLNSISASEFPYLQLEYYSKDTANLSPSQLRRWHVFFQNVPEAALSPNVFIEQSNTKLQQGEKYRFRIGVENVSELPMDSLLIKYWLVNQDKSITPIAFPRQDSLRANTFILPSLELETTTLSGAKKLWIDVNPLVANGTRYDQPEQTHFNNIAYVNFEVETDKINPILDVTFDGNYIVNGDIISPKPNILITLKDENKYLALTDTSNFVVTIKYPGETLARRIYFNNSPTSGLKFTPASLPSNKCKIDYSPNFTKDGIYELSVQAKDASRNVSGANDYTIKFEVINKSTITNVMNYPNPFTTSTKFVFTLTGSEIPTWFKIQIMTVAGRVVREITQDELGPIRIGRNITDFAWEGTDEFGDKLGNGLYIYKIFSNINGTEIEKRASGADEFFTQGFGKMYLVR